MNLLCKKLSITLLLLAGIGSAFARPDREGREEARAARQQQSAAQRGESPAGRRLEGGNGQQNNSSNDGAGKRGKLSPEERRALRRQIDEAGHDIYIPKR